MHAMANLDPATMPAQLLAYCMLKEFFLHGLYGAMSSKKPARSRLITHIRPAVQHNNPHPVQAADFFCANKQQHTVSMLQISFDLCNHKKSDTRRHAPLTKTDEGEPSSHVLW